jgi:hypothetical protein
MRRKKFKRNLNKLEKICNFTDIKVGSQYIILNKYGYSHIKVRYHYTNSGGAHCIKGAILNCDQIKRGCGFFGVIVNECKIWKLTPNLAEYYNDMFHFQHTDMILDQPLECGHIKIGHFYQIWKVINGELCIDRDENIVTSCSRMSENGICIWFEGLYDNKRVTANTNASLKYIVDITNDIPKDRLVYLRQWFKLKHST